MSKASEAFRTISEVATELDVQKHVLRFWEAKFPQIRPMKRGGGRRYYRPEDMELLRGIRHLLHAEGYTIKGVQKILREHGIDQVKAFAGKALQQQAEAPNAKRGRRVLKDGGPVTVAKAAAGRAASAAAPKAGQRQDVIDLLIAELELCRRLLVAEHTPPSPSGTAARPADPQRRRSAG